MVCGSLTFTVKVTPDMLPGQQLSFAHTQERATMTSPLKVLHFSR